MSSIMIDVSFMKFGIMFAVVYIFLRLIGMLVRFKSGEGWLALFKALSYGGLAFYIYRYASVKQLTEISIIDAFTFILCCLEFAGNLVSWIKAMAKFTAPIFNFFKESKDFSR